MTPFEGFLAAMAALGWYSSYKHRKLLKDALDGWKKTIDDFRVSNARWSSLSTAAIELLELFQDRRHRERQQSNQLH